MLKHRMEYLVVQLKLINTMDKMFIQRLILSRDGPDKGKETRHEMKERQKTT